MLVGKILRLDLENSSYTVTPTFFSGSLFVPFRSRPPSKPMVRDLRFVRYLVPGYLAKYQLQCMMGGPEDMKSTISLTIQKKRKNVMNFN